MGKLYAKYPEDVDAGAFYALSLLAAKDPDDTSLAQERKAMVVLTPLFAKDPDNPGVVHYIIHACDNPAMAAEGLAAADHYGEIAQAGPHAFHMPGHIYCAAGDCGRRMRRRNWGRLRRRRRRRSGVRAGSWTSRTRMTF